MNSVTNNAICDNMAENGQLKDNLLKIEQAIRDYHYDLDMRKHGAVAMNIAFIKICGVMNLQWEQGKERTLRETKGD